MNKWPMQLVNETINKEKMRNPFLNKEQVQRILKGEDNLIGEDEMQI